MHQHSNPIHNFSFMPSQANLYQLMLLQFLSSTRRDPLLTFSQNTLPSEQVSKRGNPFVNVDMSPYQADPQKKYKSDSLDSFASNHMAGMNQNNRYCDPHFAKQFDTSSRKLSGAYQANLIIEDSNYKPSSDRSSQKPINVSREVINLEDDDDQENNDSECFIIEKPKPINRSLESESLVMKDDVMAKIESAIMAKNLQTVRLMNTFGSQQNHLYQRLTNDSLICDLVNKSGMQMKMTGHGTSSYYSDPLSLKIVQDVRLKNQIQHVSNRPKITDSFDTNLRTNAPSNHHPLSITPVIAIEDDSDEAEIKIPEASNFSGTYGESQNGEVFIDTSKVHTSITNRQAKSSDIDCDLDQITKFQEPETSANTSYVEHNTSMQRSGKERSIRASLDSKHQQPTRLIDSTEATAQRKNSSIQVKLEMEGRSFSIAGFGLRQNELNEAETMVGSDFQTAIPKFCLNAAKSKRHKKNIKLMWNPEFLERSKLENFMRDLSKITRKQITNEEAALETLWNFNMDAEKALIMVKRNKNYYREYFNIKVRKNQK